MQRSLSDNRRIKTCDNISLFRISFVSCILACSSLGLSSAEEENMSEPISRGCLGRHRPPPCFRYMSNANFVDQITFSQYKEQTYKEGGALYTPVTSPIRYGIVYNISILCMEYNCIRYRYCLISTLDIWGQFYKK